MINPKDRYEIEQSNALVGELIPAAAKALMDGFLVQGFSREESLSFIRVWLAESFAMMKKN